MVAEAKVWVDVEDAVREWARDNVLTAARRVFFAVNNDINEPQIVVQRIAGPDDACIVQFDVWARTKVAAAALAAELATQAEALSRYINDGVLLTGIAIDGTRWQPDPESTLPRYIVEATVVAAAAS